MSVTNKEELAAFALRALGEPLVEVDITDEQKADLIDEAIEFFRDHYFDGIEKMYLKHQITAQNIADGYILLPDLIFGVTGIWSAGTLTSTNIFDVQYQLRMNDLRDLTSTSLIYYNQVMSHIALIDQMLNTSKMFRYNKLNNKLYIDQNWTAKAIEGNYYIVECYRALDPVEVPKLLDNRLMKKYVTALFKRQWGQNISKYTGITLPGGITIDGASIYQQGKDEQDEVEDFIIQNSGPCEMFIG